MTAHELPSSSSICRDGSHCGVCDGVSDAQVRAGTEVVHIWTEEC